jgi:nitrogen fixation/metabolism regulation signal transduction histidine kinase
MQIVHDLKNQLNGLKLYATFLRKRLEKQQHQTDELETVNKLIAGLDRTAKDVSLIVDCGRQVQLRKQPGTDLEKLLRNVTTTLNNENSNGTPAATGSLRAPVMLHAEATPMLGDFDPTMLADALKYISIGAIGLLKSKPEKLLEISLRREQAEAECNGLIEWKVSDPIDHDPFHSFAGSNEIRLSLAAKVIEAHGGSAQRQNGMLRVRLPLAN